MGRFPNLQWLYEITFRFYGSNCNFSKFLLRAFFYGFIVLWITSIFDTEHCESGNVEDAHCGGQQSEEGWQIVRPNSTFLPAWFLFRIHITFRTTPSSKITIQRLARGVMPRSFQSLSNLLNFTSTNVCLLFLSYDIPSWLITKTTVNNVTDRWNEILRFPDGSNSGCHGNFQSSI